MPTTKSLLILAAARDGEAFAEFFRRHGPAVLGYFARRVDDPEAAADLMAETFAAALLGLRRFRRRPEPPTSWLFAIARHKLLDYERHRRVQRSAMARLGVERRDLEDADLERVERAAVAADVGAVVRAGLHGLPDEQRAAVQARVIDDRSYRDIAGEAGATEAVIRKRVSRGLLALRRGMEKR